MFELTVSERLGVISLTPNNSRDAVQHSPARHQVKSGKKVRWKSTDGSIVIWFAKQDRNLNRPDKPLQGTYANLDFSVSDLWLSAAKGKKTGSLQIKNRPKVKENIPLKYSVLLFKGDKYYVWDPELEDGDDGGGPK